MHCVMVRQFRIDRFNGMEILVCEVFFKHTWTQSEDDALFAYREHEREVRNDPNYSAPVSDFKDALNDFLQNQKPGDKSAFYGIKWSIPVYNCTPSIVLRGAVVDNRIASLQVDYDVAVLTPEIFDAVMRFYAVMDSRHWRDMVAHQIERYGTLFEAADD